MNKISKYGQLKSQLDNYARNSLLEGDPKADPQQLVEDAAKIVIRDIIELDEKNRSLKLKGDELRSSRNTLSLFAKVFVITF